MLAARPPPAPPGRARRRPRHRDRGCGRRHRRAPRRGRARGLAAHARRHAARRGRGRRRPARPAGLQRLSLHGGARALPLGRPPRRDAARGRAARSRTGSTAAGRAASSPTRARSSPASRPTTGSSRRARPTPTATARCAISTSARCRPSRARCGRRCEANFLRDFELGYEPPTPRRSRYHITRSVLLLLGTANTTPSLRAGALGRARADAGTEARPDGARPARPRGRRRDVPPDADARAARRSAFTVIFDPETSELLSWSLTAKRRLGTPDQTHTFVRAAHVREIGDRRAEGELLGPLGRIRVCNDDRALAYIRDAGCLT